MRVLIPLAARRANRILAPSAATASDLTTLLEADPAKIDVVPNGVGVPPTSSWLDESELRQRFALGDRPLVLSVSAKRPHKNLVRLLDALALIPPERRPVLVLPGYPTWHEEELRKQATRLGMGDDVRFLGWIPDEVLEGLYRTAVCFVFPSLYEGFGLPILEAMTRGVPVACSDRGAIAEVADDAALFFDPEDSRAIAAAIETLLLDENARHRLRSAGLANASRFSWVETARGTLRVYEKALGSAA